MAVYYNKEDKNIFFMIITVLVVSIIALIAVLNGVWQIIGPPIQQISRDISHLSATSNLNYNFTVPAKK